MKSVSFILKASLLCVLLSFQMCNPSDQDEKANPPMKDFNMAGSDALAVQLADSVMLAQGGRKNWDDTRYISWNFFGSRKLYWDKHTGDVRVEYLKEDKKVLVNIDSGEGKVYMNGAEVTQPDSLQKYLQKGKEAWINDSYWLVMPFKLKDSGVTLKYLGEEATQAGEPADVLQLTYQNVGVTPENKYKVYVDKETNLVSQWAYYKNASDQEPGFVMPWKDYQTYGNIKLSGDRGERKITEIQVHDELPKAVFTSFEPVEM